MAVDFNLANATYSPISSLTEGIRQGQTMGFERQRMALAQQQADQQAKAAAEEAKAKKYESLKTLQSVYDSYDGVPSVQEHLMKTAIVPLTNEIAKDHGQQGDLTLDNIDLTNQADKEHLALITKHAAGEIDTPTYVNGLHILAAKHGKNKGLQAQVNEEVGKTIQMDSTAAVNADRDAARANTEADRSIHRLDRLDKNKADIVTKFNSDDLVKKAQSGLGYANDIENYVTSGNPIAAASIPTFMARASGEVGNLSEADKRPFGGSRAMLAKTQQALEQMATGKLTPDNQKFLLGMTALMRANSTKKIDDLAKVRSKQYSKAYRDVPADEIYASLSPGASPSDSSGAPPPPADTGGWSYVGPVK